MIEFNLLPWRENKKSREKKVFMIIMASVIIFNILFLLSWYYYLEFKCSQINNDIVLLEEEKQNNLFAANTVETKNSLILNDPAQDIIQHNLLIKTLLLQFPTLPETICFSQITTEPNTILFVGRVSSALDFTEFMMKWPGVKFFSVIKIMDLRNNLQSNSWEFKFKGLK